MRKPVIICPRCGEPAQTAQTSYGLRAQCCGLWSWGGKPLVSAATHEARKAAHEAFDHLWKVEGWNRSFSYRLLAEELGIDGKDCHMALMPAELARRVPEAVVRVRERLKLDPKSVLRRNERLKRQKSRREQCAAPWWSSSSSSSGSSREPQPSTGRPILSLARSPTQSATR